MPIEMKFIPWISFTGHREDHGKKSWRYPNVLGVWHGRCLLHVSMYGLPGAADWPTIYLPCSTLQYSIQNSTVHVLLSLSLLDIIDILKYSGQSREWKLYNKTLRIGFESTWRYSRCFNSNYPQNWTFFEY